MYDDSSSVDILSIAKDCKGWPDGANCSFGINSIVFYGEI